MGADLKDQAQGPGPNAQAKPRNRSSSLFVLKNVVAWLSMVIVLVVVPDSLEGRVGLALARIIGWAVAFPIWLLIVERNWQARFGPIARFALQVPLWVAAALVADWISGQARINLG